MKQRFQTTALLATLALTAVGCSSGQDNLDKLCTAAEAASAETSYEAREAQLRQLELSGGIKTAWDAVQGASRGQRYELMQAAAEEVGVANWSCPALRDHWASE